MAIYIVRIPHQRPVQAFTVESEQEAISILAEKMGLTEYRETTLCGDPYLNFGPTFGAHIERA